MDLQHLRAALEERAIACKTEYSLRRHISFKLDCTAALAILPQSEEELIVAAALCRRAGIRTVLLGRGSNLFFAKPRYEGQSF